MLRGRGGRIGGETFLAKITGWATLGGTGARWKYAWSEIIIDSDTDAVKSGGRSGTTTTGYALNLCELNNVASGVQGNSVDNSGADYPAGFDLQPVGAGSAGTVANEVCVVMQRVIDADNNVKYVFAYENADDGTCEAAEE